MSCCRMLIVFFHLISLWRTRSLALSLAFLLFLSLAPLIALSRGRESLLMYRKLRSARTRRFAMLQVRERAPTANAYSLFDVDSCFLAPCRASLHLSLPPPTSLPNAFCALLQMGGAQIWLKREDLAHTGAHKINNAIGQALLAKVMFASRHLKFHF